MQSKSNIEGVTEQSSTRDVQHEMEAGGCDLESRMKPRLHACEYAINHGLENQGGDARIGGRSRRSPAWDIPRSVFRASLLKMHDRLFSSAGTDQPAPSYTPSSELSLQAGFRLRLRHIDILCEDAPNIDCSLALPRKCHNAPHRPR